MHTPYLVVQRIQDVKCLEDKNQPHGVCHVVESATPDSLFAQHADINEDPEDKTRPEFVERLDVK